jgi:hypothetical protein
LKSRFFLHSRTPFCCFTCRSEPKWWRGSVRRASGARDANTLDVLPCIDKEVFQGFVLPTEGAAGANERTAPRAQGEGRPFVLPTEGAPGANERTAPRAQVEGRPLVLPTEGAAGANERTAPRAQVEGRPFVLPTEGAAGANIRGDTQVTRYRQLDLSPSTTRISVLLATSSSIQGLPNSSFSLSTRFGCVSCWTVF